MINIDSLLTPALQAYLIALIYRNTRSSCLSLAALCSWVSHDSLNRLLHSEFPWSGRLGELLASHLVKTGGYLVLDDTTWEHWAKHSEAVHWVWSSSAGHITQGMQVVLLLWTDGVWKVPIGIRRWRKGEQSKIELASEMLKEAAERGLQPDYLLFDSWCTARGLLNLMAELGWKYVARIKSNRKEGRRFFVSNDLEIKPAQIKPHYRARQQIEETFRLLKQEFAWGGASVRKAKAQEAHLHLGRLF